MGGSKLEKEFSWTSGATSSDKDIEFKKTIVGGKAKYTIKGKKTYGEGCNSVVETFDINIDEE